MIVGFCRTLAAVALLLCTANSISAAITIEESTERLDIDRSGVISSAVTEAGVSDPPPETDFAPAPRLSKIYLGKVLWLQFEIEAGAAISGERFLLEFPSNPGSVRLFQRGKSEVLNENGSLTPLNKRPYSGPHIVLPLPIKPGERATFIARLEGRFPLSNEVRLFSERAWQKENQTRQLSFAVYFGALASILIFNLLLFLMSPIQSERLYYIISQCLVHVALPANLIGYTLYLWPNALVWDYELRYLVAGVGAPAVALFSAKFLNLRAKAPRLGWFVLSTGFILLPLSLWGYVNPWVGATGAPIVVFVLLVAALTAGIYRTLQGDRSSRWFVSGTGVLLASVMAYLAIYRGFWSPTFIELRPVWIIQVGSLVDAIMLAVAILEKIRIERDVHLEREHAMNESLAVARNAAEEANQAKSQFIRNMSHELRTPLNSLVGYSEILLKSLEDPKLRLDMAGVINRNAEQLASIVTDILEFTTIEKGTLKVSAKEFDLQELLEEVRDIFLPTALRSGIRITLESDLSQRKFRGDRFLTRQILMNIVGNACKFTTTGEVRIASQDLLRGGGTDVSSQKNPGVQLRIIDTGRGIEPESQKRIFDPFFQTDSGLTREHGGTGLGLTLSRGLARAMGGDVRLFSSAVGVGSEFIIDLPELSST